MDKQIENVLKYNALINGKLEPAVLTYMQSKLFYGMYDLSDLLDSVFICFLEGFVDFLHGKTDYATFADKRNAAMRHAAMKEVSDKWKKTEAKLFKLILFGK